MNVVSLGNSVLTLRKDEHEMLWFTLDLVLMMWGRPHGGLLLTSTLLARVQFRERTVYFLMTFVISVRFIYATSMPNTQDS